VKPHCHSCESRNPGFPFHWFWIPVFTGMTKCSNPRNVKRKFSDLKMLESISLQKLRNLSGRLWYFIRLRRRLRSSAVDECVNLCRIHHEPKFGCSGGFRCWRITRRSPRLPKNLFGGQVGVGGYFMKVPRALPVELHSPH